MLNDLGSLIDGDEVGIELSVLSDEGSVLVLSGVLFSGSSSLVVCNVLGDLSDVDLSLLEGLS